MNAEPALRAQNIPPGDREIEARAEKALDQLAAARKAIGGVVFGQEPVVEEALVTLLSGGHALFVGAPGLAKTLLVETLGRVLGLHTNRVQFTPDLMPTDILGSEVLEESADHRRAFRFIKGPIFAQLLMADEINRASPRTQSALLQAMQEYHVTIAGERYDLPKPFHVLATQNPLEQEGVYPLPEAQLDRFLMQIDVPYPAREAEKRILIETTGRARPARAGDRRRGPDGHPGIGAADAGRRLGGRWHPRSGARRAPRRGRSGLTQHIAWGPGPRAAQSLMLACRARALAQGRIAPRQGRRAGARRPGAETSHGADL